MRLTAPHAISETVNQYHIAAGVLQQASTCFVISWNLYSSLSGGAIAPALISCLLRRSPGQETQLAPKAGHDRDCDEQSKHLRDQVANLRSSKRVIRDHSKQSDNRKSARCACRHKYSQQVKPVQTENQNNRPDSDMKPRNNGPKSRESVRARKR